jgi:hypothetical protein
MKINELASKPTLIQIDLDTADIVEKYGEPVTFWTYDIVSLSTYFDFYNARTNSEFDSLSKMMNKLILLEDGSAAIQEGEDLPIDIAAAAINKIGEILGKSQSRSSTPKVGKQAK